MASTEDHCLIDLLWRNRRGELDMPVVMVIANHPDSPTCCAETSIWWCWHATPPIGGPKERGVKLVGATAHYVTANLDEGPTIEQHVVRVDHRHSLDDLTRLSADVERAVLSQCEDRIIRYGNQTIVSGPGPSRWANASTALRQADGACLSAAESYV